MQMHAARDRGTSQGRTDFTMLADMHNEAELLLLLLLHNMMQKLVMAVAMSSLDPALLHIWNATYCSSASGFSRL